MAISRSASALAIAASFWILDMLSWPRELIRLFSSVTRWILQEMIWMPSAFISVWALDCTSSPNFLRSLQISFRVMVPMISRMLPCKESTIARLKSSSVIFRKFFMANWMPSGSVITRTLATASTSTPMKSWVGI